MSIKIREKLKNKGGISREKKKKRIILKRVKVGVYGIGVYYGYKIEYGKAGKDE